jgi:hypothetical protein
MARVPAHASAVVALLVAGHPALEARTPAPPIPFELVANHLVVVSGDLGSMAGLTMVVDTGTTRTVVDERIARRLPAEPQPDVLRTFGRSSATARVSAPAIALGSMRSAPLDVLVADLGFLDARVGRRVDALVGADVFRDRCLTIDYAARRLDLECQGPLDRRTDFTPPLPIVHVTIDGHPYRLIADSGSEVVAVFRTSLPPSVTPPPDAAASATHLTGGMQLGRFASRAVLVGGHSIGAPPIFVVPVDQRVEGYDGVLGTRWLTDRQVRIDFPRGTLSWTP